MKQRMRISALLLALVLCLSLLPVPAFAAPVTFAAAFPSENFRQQLNDAVLTPAGLTAEDETELTDAHLAALRAATSLSLQDIWDYTGLELLTGLTELTIDQKYMAIWLDLRANTKLQKLDCRNSRLEKLDITGLTELQELNCSNTRLSQLDLSTNTKLETLICSASELCELNLQNNRALRYLKCGITHIKSLDLRSCPDLEELNCLNGELEQLDVSGCPALRKFNCDLNALRMLDLSQNTALEEVILGYQTIRSDAPLTPHLDGTYSYDMALLSTSFDYNRIILGSGATLDLKTGVMTFQNHRSSFSYHYDTKAPTENKNLIVTVSVPESEEDTRPNPFADVAATQYYYQPVLWAYYHNVVAGTSATTFSPDAPCTRAQIVTFLWRAAGKPTVSGSTPFVDVDRNAYYAQAVAWAVDQGITAGTTATTFSPNAPCTRAQSVCFLWRYFGSPPGLMLDTFDDVPADAYYTWAVAWATMNRITSGIGDGLFAPDGTCTRAQIVSFLYRAQV